jgi:hypothetical protein
MNRSSLTTTIALSFFGLAYVQRDSLLSLNEIISVSQMMKLLTLCITCLATTVTSLSCQITNGAANKPLLSLGSAAGGEETSRADFLSHTALIAAAGITTTLLTASPEPAVARGRATLEQAYDRYTPRILAGGEFYKDKLKNMIASNDFSAIKSALAEPPKKQKEDRAKADGGISERAAQAGQFSDARVIVAMDLFAAQFSDNSISPKTKAMKKEVDELRSIVEDMSSLARQALGEESVGGGFFGLGKKQPSKSEISQKLKELYIAGGTAWNRYVFAANDGLPVTLNKLPYL